jgi:hypothetical protein
MLFIIFSAMQLGAIRSARLIRALGCIGYGFQEME